MKIYDNTKLEKLIKKIEEKNKIIRLLIFLISCFIVSVIYNVIFAQNNIVMGGMSGLAIVMKKVTGLTPGIFLVISTIILLIISYFIVDKKLLKNNLVGSIVYPIMVTLTSPIANNIDKTITNQFYIIVLGTIIYGIFMGLIYKVGYNTGGADLINQMVCKFIKISVGQAGIYINIVIITISLFVFGLPKLIYGLFSLILTNTVVDIILLGNNDSKICYIKSHEINKIEKFLARDFKLGYSVLSSSSALDNKERKTIFCVVTSREYDTLINLILQIDTNAFITSFNCYESIGGKRKKLVKFD